MGPTRIPSGWGDSSLRALSVYLNRRHHALVLVREDVAVVDEPADDRRIREGYYDLHLASDGHVDDVAVVVGRLRNAVDLGELVGPLVNVKGVQLVRLVADRPLLDGAELDADVGPVHVELFAVNEERIAVPRLGVHDRTPVGDLLAEILDWKQCPPRRQSDRRRR